MKISRFIRFLVIVGVFVVFVDTALAKSVRERLREAREQEYQEKLKNKDNAGLKISTTSTKKKSVTNTAFSTEKKPHVDRIGLNNTKTLYISMETFHTVNGRYPNHLDELTKAKPPYLWESFFDEPYDYIYEGGEDTYSLHVVPQSGKGTHFYTDESTKIYFKENAKADKRSDVYQ